MDAGTRLGHFTILSSLGKGGMGEVWRARDTVLGREVALKTLPRELARDSERLARFEREARLLAAVSHPNIAAIYGLEHDGDERFLVLELIDGETLGERLAPGALPLTESLRLALQIAEALEAAHERGVIHRDLKPANIKINREGKIKVLDFGLAKALASFVYAAGPTQSLTLQRDSTSQGTVLGTTAYMSPEQARAEPVDVRADIWAFGCVLFEMLTGSRTFEGRTVTDILAGVLRGEPDWARLPRGLHPRVRYLLERCLEKEPRNRYVGIADARVEIEKALAAPAGPVAAPTAGGAARPAWARWVPATVAAAVAGLGGAALVANLNRAADLAVVRFVQPLDVPGMNVLGVPLVDISRDGTRIAYANGQRILVRDLDDPELQPVPGVGGVLFSPKLSHDGTQLAYGQGPPPYSVRTLRLPGGVPQIVASDIAAVPLALEWAGSDALLFVQPEGIVQVPLEGGERRVIVAAAPGEALGSPHLLPGGDALLYTSTTAEGPSRWDAGEIVIQSLVTQKRRVVLRGGSDARYVSSGHLVYAQGSALWAVPFDLRAQEVTGSRVQVIDGVSRAPTQTERSDGSDTAQYAVSDSGTLVYLDAPGSRGLTSARGLTWVKRDGTSEPIDRVAANDFTFARVSPDGQHVALVVGDTYDARASDIWSLEVGTQALQKLTFTRAAEYPVWAPGSDRLYFREVDNGGITSLYAVAADGGTPELIARAPGATFMVPWDITPDGHTLLLMDFTQANDIRLATLDLADREITELFDAPGSQLFPSIASNGQWIVYGEAGALMARPYPNVLRTLIPIGTGSSSPVFSRNHPELFYADDGGIAAVAVDFQPSFRADAPRRLFPTDGYYLGRRTRAWDPSPDGDRFLMILAPREADTTAKLHVAVNWLEDLKQRAPAR